MKDQKVLAAGITEVVENKLKESGDQPKAVKKAIKKSAGKLAKKLTKLFKKADKKLKKANKVKKADKIKAVKAPPVELAELIVPS